jgi:hypothetical protein
MVLFNDSTVCSSKNIHVLSCTTVSRAHHLPYAITGVHEAIASNGTIPKSSSGGKINAFAFAYKSTISLNDALYFH